MGLSRPGVVTGLRPGGWCREPGGCVLSVLRGWWLCLDAHKPGWLSVSGLSGFRTLAHADSGGAPCLQPVVTRRGWWAQQAGCLPLPPDPGGRGSQDASPLPPRVSWLCGSLNSTREPGFTTEEFQEFPISLKIKPLQDLLRGSEGHGTALCSRRGPCAQGSALGVPSLLPAPLGPPGLGRGAWRLLSRARRPLSFLSAPRPLDGSVKLPAGWPRRPGWRQFTHCAGKWCCSEHSFTLEKHIQRL